MKKRFSDNHDLVVVYDTENVPHNLPRKNANDLVRQLGWSYTVQPPRPAKPEPPPAPVKVLAAPKPEPLTLQQKREKWRNVNRLRREQLLLEATDRGIEVEAHWTIEEIENALNAG